MNTTMQAREKPYVSRDTLALNTQTAAGIGRGLACQVPPAPHYLAVLRGLVEHHSLAHYAAKYLAEEVYGLQSLNTLDAKSRDLAAFVRWLLGCYGSAHMDAWLPRDTQTYLDHLEQQGRAATTINRVFATLRHFARWAHEQPGQLFGPTGLPTRGVKELVVDEPPCQKFSKSELQRLFAAADRLVDEKRRKNQRPRRNRAILALLYYTGLRVSELVALRLDQYDGRYLHSIKRKGKARCRDLYVSAQCRRLLDDYLQHERPLDAVAPGRGALVTATGSNHGMTRRMVAKALDAIAHEVHAAPGQMPLDIHPHRLRHTFGAEYRERTGSDTETAVALGHTSLEYVGRYVRKTRQEREEVMDAI